MTSFLKNLKHYWDISTNRYEVFPATDAVDVQACMHVLEEVRRNELNRVAGGSVLSSHALAGTNPNYILMACRDTKTGDIIGCMRITPASEVMDNPGSRVEYALDNIPIEHIKTLAVYTRLAVLKPYRKTSAALVLMAESTVHWLSIGGQGALMACEPSLYTMYKQIGLRPIGPLHNSPSGGYRIPMLLVIEEDYLRSINSPVARWLKKLDIKSCEPLLLWFREWYKAHNVHHFGISKLKDADLDLKVYEVLTSGLSPDGCKAFLKNALVIRCQENDLLIAAEDGGKGLGIVLDGKVGVVIEGKKLVELQPGDLFGEIAFVLDRRRTASLVATAPDTQILLFSPSAYHRLEDESDKKSFWRNLARVLAQRVLVSDKLLA